MTQGKTDGKHPNFRVLCKQCNSYMYTAVGLAHGRIRVVCTKCGNSGTLEEDIDV